MTIVDSAMTCAEKVSDFLRIHQMESQDSGVPPQHLVFCIRRSGKIPDNRTGISRNAPRKCERRLSFWSKIMKSILPLLLFFHVHVMGVQQASQSPVSLSFHQLDLHSEISTLQNALIGFHQKEVIIRGFLYQGSDGGWILAAEPNLRTCCVGASAKVMQQIFLNDKFIGESQQRAVTLQGKFFVEPIWTEGSLKRLYQMDQAVILPYPRYSWPLLVIAIIIIGLGCGVYVWNYLRTKST